MKIVLEKNEKLHLWEIWRMKKRKRAREKAEKKRERASEVGETDELDRLKEIQELISDSLKMQRSQNHYSKLSLRNFNGHCRSFVIEYQRGSNSNMKRTDKISLTWIPYPMHRYFINTFPLCLDLPKISISTLVYLKITIPN